MSRRGAGLGAVAILAVLALGISNASAASLSVIAGKLGTFNVADRCATGPLAVAVAGTSGVGGTYTQVSIASVPAACNGLAIKVTVFGASGNSLGTSVLGAVAATGTTTVTMTGSYTGAAVLGAALTIGGYGMTTTWTGAAASCVVTQARIGGVWQAPTTQTCSVVSTTVTKQSGSGTNHSATVTVTIHNDSNVQIRWLVNADLGQSPPYMTWTTHSVTLAVGASLASGCGSMPFVSISGGTGTVAANGTKNVAFTAYENASGTSC
jgi:hypothetical protein